MRNPDEAKYTISQASQIADVNLNTARSWFAKGWIYSEKDKKAVAAGGKTLLSERSVLATAVAAKLVALGMHPQNACSTAGSFSGRVPLPWDHTVFTALIVYPDGWCKILPFQKMDGDGQKQAESLQTVFFPKNGPQSRYEAAYTLFVDFIVKQVAVGLQQLEDASQKV